VAGANDFASLAEVLQRRFKKEDWPKPDLVLLDGGKGQLSTVLLETRNLKLETSQFIALAKRAEEIFQGQELKPINLDPTSAASRLLQRIRDEAHRFGQAYYHSRHGKTHIKSRLDEIPGVGPKAKKLLMQKFGSLAGIKQADKNDIIQLIGKSKAEKLLENL
ncbi:MAG: helix-hairpin-helix domain-containing protein, partial [Patescibacteria group bacterium]